MAKYSFPLFQRKRFSTGVHESIFIQGKRSLNYNFTSYEPLGLWLCYIYFLCTLLVGRSLGIEKVSTLWWAWNKPDKRLTWSSVNLQSDKLLWETGFTFKSVWLPWPKPHVKLGRKPRLLLFKILSVLKYLIEFNPFNLMLYFCPLQIALKYWNSLYKD